MSSHYPTWQDDLEPNQTSVRQWLENIYTKVQPLEQARWNQSNIDTLFYAGAQTFVNRYFNFNANTNSSGYYFNLIQQNINMVTGYQRQHRKAPIVLPINGSDGQTADQFTKALISQYNMNGIHEQISRGFEQSCITGMVLAQPYLDYSGDAAQGDIKLKIWEYNSFLVDPYFRDLVWKIVRLYGRKSISVSEKRKNDSLEKWTRFHRWPARRSVMDLFIFCQKITI